MSVPYSPGDEPNHARLYVGAGHWITVDVPDGANSFNCLLVGAGGSGGVGHTRAAGAAGGGGGGGGSGSCSRVSGFSLAWLPNRKLNLFLAAGGSGTPSFLGIRQDVSSAGFQILRADAGGGGGNGSTTVSGTVGAAGVIGTAAMANLASLGVPSFLVGQTGSLGGAVTGAAGSYCGWGATGLIISGGSGGGGCTTTDFAGGALGGSGYVPTLAAGQALANGNPGNRNLGPLPFCQGGTGGGSNNVGIAGNGGDGALGCGGGGGGAGATGGLGGLGGAAFAFINWCN